jgi:alkanesulfonate monooxygenase SsuD/methylene tetrahydromethanopterin reductase-like flavin-dependent oxidoreductase (luciferase family)
VRAVKLDEGLEVLAGLWRAEPFSYDGAHHHLTRAELLPGPRQPQIPIWVGGMWPDSRAPFRRAARFDGVHPLLFSVPLAEQPDAIREVISYVDAHRAEPGHPYDVAFGADTVGDQSSSDRELVAEFAAAGVTWWMEPISHWRAPLAQLRERIRRGPPRI